MSLVTTVTTKGQVTIPIEIRRCLDIKSGQRIEFMRKKNGDILIKPVIDFLSLGGSLKTAKKRNIEDYDKLLKKNFKKKYDLLNNDKLRD